MIASHPHLARALMDFPQRLVRHRKDRKLTQQALADLAGIHITQVQRYEKGDAQPTLEMIRKLSKALTVSADELLFDEDERGPATRCVCSSKRCSSSTKTNARPRKPYSKDSSSSTRPSSRSCACSRHERTRRRPPKAEQRSQTPTTRPAIAGLVLYQRGSKSLFISEPVNAR